MQDGDRGEFSPGNAIRVSGLRLTGNQEAARVMITDPLGYFGETAYVVAVIRVRRRSRMIARKLRLVISIKIYSVFI
jgi:hypothetical protein